MQCRLFSVYFYLHLLVLCSIFSVSFIIQHAWLAAGVATLALGSEHSMIMKYDGSVWSTAISVRGTGSGIGYGQRLIQVIKTGAKAASAGCFHNIVLKQDNSVWVTGRNNFGQLGNGANTCRSTFVQVIAGGIQAGAAGGSHSMVVKHDGSLWATGANLHGQLGDGSMIAKKIFVKVLLSRDGAW